MTSTPPGPHTGVLRRTTLATVALIRDGAEVARWPLAGAGRPELAVVDELSRLQLAARRAGCSIRLCDACVELAQLIDLAGLAGALPIVAALRRKVCGEAEAGEERCVEEVVQPGNPIA